MMASPFTAADQVFMAEALALARAVLGRTGPNPGVGCVIVRDGQIIGRGATQSGGRPHAEAVALAAAGANCKAADVFVTLEPCAHTSPRGPSCADLLAGSGVKRVVAAMVDPDPRTAGAGLERLRRAGIEAREGLMETEARALLAGFIHRLRTGQPLVIAAQDDGTFDGDLILLKGETMAQALNRLGQAGMMRVRVNPGTGFD